MKPHGHWMARALQLAARGRETTFPNPRVGCVVVREGQVVGEGWHQRAGEAHAEVFALRQAGASARGADCYVTLEPCAHHGRTPPCADAVVAAGLGRVFVAQLDPDSRVAGRGVERLREAGIAVEVGLLEAQARRLNRAFLSRIERGRPYVTLKWGASLDGRTASAGGESQWITGEAARRDVHRLRAEAGAVLTSRATVEADDPRLTVRGREVARQPDRIVLDSQGRVPAQSAVWAPGARRLWVTSTLEAAAPDGVEHIVIAPGADGRLDLGITMAALAGADIGEVLVESGPVLAGALLDAGFVDELVIYLAPMLLGDAAPGLARLRERLALADHLALDIDSVRKVGPDLRISARPRQI